MTLHCRKEAEVMRWQVDGEMTEDKGKQQAGCQKSQFMQIAMEASDHFNRNVLGL